jgi:hypothetical protein
MLKSVRFLMFAASILTIGMLGTRANAQNPAQQLRRNVPGQCRSQKPCDLIPLPLAPSKTGSGSSNG